MIGKGFCAACCCSLSPLRAAAKRRCRRGADTARRTVLLFEGEERSAYGGNAPIYFGKTPGESPRGVRFHNAAGETLA